MSANTLFDIRKIPFDSLTLRATILELQERLVSGQVQDIRQPAASDLQLGIRCQGRNFLLLLSCDSQFARVHLTTTRRPNSQQPPSFCMALRKHLENGIVREIQQRDFDRILEITIETKTEETVLQKYILVAELMGKHSNLILLHPNGTIIDSAKRISRRINRIREILPGLPYETPPGQSGRLDPFDPDTPARLQRDIADSATNCEAVATIIAQQVAGMSPFLAKVLALRATAADSALPLAWANVFGALRHGSFSPVLIHCLDGQPLGAYPFPLPEPIAGTQTAVRDLNGALDAAFSRQIARAGYEAVYGELRGKLDHEIARLNRQKQIAERALLESDKAEGHKQAGEMILSNLFRIEPGATMLLAPDYYQPNPADRAIALDPRLSAQENAEAYFKRYRKARDGQENAIEYAMRLENTLERLKAARSSLLVTTNEQEVRNLRAELVTAGLLRGEDASARESESAPSGPDFQGHKIRRYNTPEGYDIYIGETATANDFLTTRIAAPNDIWMHVRASTSAHVIIRTHGKPDMVPRSVLERAAGFCAQHSAQKHSSLIPVDYTLRKYVRKPRGSAPGSVDYQREKTLEVTLSFH